MEKVFVVSEDAKLYNFLLQASKYGEYLDNIEFINATSVTNIVERNTCVIIDKANYELDVLRLFAKKMYVIVCVENTGMQIDIEEDNKILVIDKPYNLEQIYSAVKLMLKYKEMENELYKNKDAEHDVRRVAETDYLTGLPNRRGMYEHFACELKSEKVHCMFIDIDNFKKVNDTYGHKMGDKLLIRVSHMIKDKAGDAFLARLSGDEFAIIIDGDVSKEQVITIAENIMGAVGEVQLGVDVSSIISFSIGIMFDQSSNDDLDDILLRCDVAMYNAKKNGKGRYVVYNDIEKQVEYKMNVDKDKYVALNTGQFKIYFQPRINMVTSGMDGVEAGIYWEHPKDGLRKPDDFIDILEEDSFIVELEKRMMEELFRIMSGWKKSNLETTTVYFRLSKKHLFRKDFVSKLNEMMELHGLRPEKICLGFSEIETHPKVKEAIQELKRCGYEISCVKSIANNKTTLLSANDTMADEWILDNSLVKDVCNNRTVSTLVRGIISLAKELGIRVISRGISSDEQIDMLTKYSCDVGEGKYFSKPLKPVDFYDYAIANILEKNNTYIYDLDGKLSDQNGKNEGHFVGDKCSYIYDEELGKQVVHFPGESVVILENTIELPAKLLKTKNYSISLTLKVEDVKLWGSVFYAEFANGFSSIMPYAWDGVAMYRVKDSMYEDEWHDAIGQEIALEKWNYLTATYNSKKHESRLYVNGELVATRENVHTVEDPKRIVVGGDVWMGTFKGMVGNVVIHDFVLSSEEARNEYMFYLGGGNGKKTG